MSGKRITDVDVEVGQRIALRRKILGLSQGELAKAVGVTWQQIQKNEKGVNRISVGRLVLIAERLGVKAGYFFEGLEPGSEPPEQLSGPAMKAAIAISRIPDEPAQKTAADLAVRIAEEIAELVERGMKA